MDACEVPDESVEHLNFEGFHWIVLDVTDRISESSCELGAHFLGRVSCMEGMASIPDDFQGLFEKETVAHVTTVLPDETLHSTAVWIDYDAETDRLLINTERERRKTKNARNDPRVAVSMTDPDNPYRMLSITGEVAEITTNGAREHIDELAQRYMGVDDYPNPIESERVIISIAPTEVRQMEG